MGNNSSSDEGSSNAMPAAEQEEATAELAYYDCTSSSMELAGNAPLGNIGDHLVAELLFTGAMTGELEEAYKILMLGGVDVRFSGLTRELEAEVWERIHKVPWQAAV